MNDEGLPNFLSIRGQTAGDATPLIWEVQQYFTKLRDDFKYEANFQKAEFHRNTYEYDN